MTWSAHPLDESEIKRLEEDMLYSDEYCSWCDFGEGTPEDDCFCEEHCGVIGCQGLNSSEKS